MELKDIISKITVNKEWHDRYCKLVPKFIESAKTCENWQDWDKSVFYEFFEKDEGNCIFPHQQDFFTNEEKEKIKSNWKYLAPMLKEIAKSQNTPLWYVYENIELFIRNYTDKDRKYATRRLIASLQPNLLCTILEERYLRETYKLLDDTGTIECQHYYDPFDWYKSSLLLLSDFQHNRQKVSFLDFCTYPWQVREYLKNQSVNKFSTNMQTYIDILKSNKNLVLTGAPGTGKTFLAKQIARCMLFGKSEENELNKEEKAIFAEHVEFVQFHPSYDYTDFVEGLRPIENEEGQLGFIRKDGVFKNFCKKSSSSTAELLSESWNLLVQHLKKQEKPYEYLLKSKNWWHSLEYIEENSRILIYDAFKSGGETYHHAPIGSVSYDEMLDAYNSWLSYNEISVNPFINPESTNERDIVLEILGYNYGLPLRITEGKPYIFIIDEINRGELSKIFGELFFAIDPGYRGIKGKVNTQYQNLIDAEDKYANGFYVPENVYILATMNDIDRSVESMDFALRRRFAWMEIKPKDRLEMLKENLNSDICEKAKRVMTALNNAISNTRGLGSAYQIGPAYFLKLKDENYNGNFDKLWEMHIEIVLKEYLRGYSNADAKVEEFKKIYSEAINDSRIVATD